MTDSEVERPIADAYAARMDEVEAIGKVEEFLASDDLGTHDGTPEWEYQDCSICGGARCGA